MRHVEKTNFERSGDMQPTTLPYTRNVEDFSSNGRAIRSTQKERRGPAPFEVGWLSEDPPVLAARIAHACAYGTTTVWIDDECRVHCAMTNAPPMPLHWIVGIYTCGVSPDDIVDDLIHERAQRERVWMLA